MTRNQTAGIPAIFGGEQFLESSWGWGWDVHGTKRMLRGGSLHSASAFMHGGSGGCELSLDPTFDVLAVFLSVQNYPGQNIDSPMWRADLFNNALIAAIDDV